MSNTIPIKNDKQFCKTEYRNFIDSYMSLFKYKQINWNTLTDFVPVEIALKHPEIKWNWITLSRHKFTKFDFIFAHPELPWNWRYVCKNPNLKLQIIIDNPDYPWSCEYLSCNPAITPQIINHFPDGDWRWHDISQCINIKHIVAYPDMPWVWNVLHNNKTITTKFIENNIDKRWDWKCLSFKQKLIFDLAFKYSNKSWDWHRICRWNLKHMEARHAKHRIGWMNIVAIHKYFNQPEVMKMDTVFKSVELVLMDEYLTKMILQY
jgi:hypothetical protein